MRNEFNFHNIISVIYHVDDTSDFIPYTARNHNLEFNEENLFSPNSSHFIYDVFTRCWHAE